MLTEIATGRKKDSSRLIWDTKPRRAPNPKDIEFQTAELVIPNPARDQAVLSSYALPALGDLDRSKTNRLIWGDNLLAMQALLSSGYEGQINLIYIDPPFWTGENYYANVTIGGESITKSPSVIERLAYKDYWQGGIDSYLDMLYPRLHLMKRLLVDDGAIFIHTDWHIGHYVKIIADEVFGKENFRNEIVWRRTSSHNDPNKFGNVHESILFYTKSENWCWTEPKVEYEDWYKERYYRYKEETGRRFFSRDLTAPAHGHSSGIYNWQGANPPPGRMWAYTQDNMKELDNKGLLFYTKEGIPRLKLYLDEMEGAPVQSIWEDILSVVSWSNEATGFPTQKPAALLDRIISACTEEGDLVADFFCGSGTTLDSAESLKRRWIGCDFSKVAIQIARNRLVDQGAKPFLVENIGNYQRQLIYLTGSRIHEIQAIVLKLYGAIQRKDLPELGVKRNGEIDELVYVGYPDRPVSAKKVEELEATAEKLDGRGYDALTVLGWDYEYNYDEILQERKRASKRRWKIDPVPKIIPPEVIEYLKQIKTDQDVEQFVGKIRFHDKPFLKLLPPTLIPRGDATEVTVGIDRYVVFDYPIEDQDQRKELEEIVGQSPLALVDYWAVDWDYDGITFKSNWQAIRQHGRKIETVPRTATRNLQARNKHDVAVRVVDVFGNDASKILSIDLRR